MKKLNSIQFELLPITENFFTIFETISFRKISLISMTSQLQFADEFNYEALEYIISNNENLEKFEFVSPLCDTQITTRLYDYDNFENDDYGEDQIIKIISGKAIREVFLEGGFVSDIFLERCPVMERLESLRVVPRDWGAPRDGELTLEGVKKFVENKCPIIKPYNNMNSLQGRLFLEDIEKGYQIGYLHNFEDF